MTDTVMGSRFCIIRIDAGPRRTARWKVKVRRRRQNFIREFGDQEYGNTETALVAAQKYRDQILAEHPPVSSYENAIRVTRNNNSGIVGVFKRRKRVRRGRRVHWYDVWTAVGTPEPGCRRTRDFYVKHHGGDDIARDLAIAQRQRWVESLRDYESTHGITRLRTPDPRETRPLLNEAQA